MGLGRKKFLSERHENDLAALFPHASKTAGSGAKRESHDVRTLVFKVNEWWLSRIEAKCTQKKSYSIKLSEWRQLEADVYSSSAQERPVLAVRFYGEGEDDSPVAKDLVVTDLNDYVELLAELEKLRGDQA